MYWTAKHAAAWHFYSRFDSFACAPVNAESRIPPHAMEVTIRAPVPITSAARNTADAAGAAGWGARATEPGVGVEGARKPSEGDSQRERARGRDGDSEGDQWSLKRQRMQEQDDDLRSAPLLRQSAPQARGGGGGDGWPSRSARPHGFEYEDPFEASDRGGSGGDRRDPHQGWMRGVEDAGKGGSGNHDRVGWGVRDEENDMGAGRRGWDRDFMMDVRSHRPEGGAARGARGWAEGVKGAGAGPKNDFISSHEKLRQDLAEKHGRRGAAGAGGQGRGGGSGDWQQASHYSSSGSSAKTLGGKRSLTSLAPCILTPSPM